MTLIPDNILKCMDPADRAKLGKRGLTMEQSIESAIAKAEKEIQKQISQLLALREVPYINPPMHKRSMLPEGWPDFTLAYKGVPLAIEVKIPGEKPRANQSEMHEKLTAIGWSVHVVTTLAEVQQILRAIDQPITPAI